MGSKIKTLVSTNTYAFACLLTLDGVVEQAAVDDRDESVALDVGRKLQVAVRFADVPFFLELGGGFTII